MSIWKYAERWGAPPSEFSVTLGEGDTPLIRSHRIGPALGLKNLWFKYEGGNPTGSYKDRFAAAAVSHLKQTGKSVCLGTSSGNTGAAVAAYCARAGIACHLAIVEGAPEGKLRQMRAYGAHLHRVKGFGKSPTVTETVMAGLRNLATELQAGFEISAFAFSPDGMRGVETIAYELADHFGDDPFSVFSPAGGGGLTLAVARGLEHATSSGRVHCVQPAGNDTIATPLRVGVDLAVAVESTTTISGLQVGSVLDGDEVIAACRRRGGTGVVVSDESVLKWQSRLAREEGIFCEPAGAVAVAGVAEACRRGEIPAAEPVVCLVTGVGFKDEQSLVGMTGAQPTPMVRSFDEFSAAVKAAVTPVKL
ncbi:MAG: threonine synthase [Synoicihabitans sp.]